MQSQDLPRTSHPPSSSTIEANRLVPTVFPYKRLDALPSLSYVIENLLVSIFTAFTGLFDSVFTFYVWIPLGLARSVISFAIRLLLGKKPNDQKSSKVVVITGASSGIGAGLVAAYAAPGTTLVLLARNEGRLNDSAKIARTAGCSSVETHSIDFSQDGAHQSIKETLEQVRQKHGSIDVLIANAATVTYTDDNPQGPMPWGAETALWLNKINLVSTCTFILSGWELMKQQGSGNICILSSSVALASPPQFGVYGATKAYLMSFAQSLRILSTPYGIKVTCILPGFIESGQTHDMLSAGSLIPTSALADTQKMAKRIKLAIEEEQAIAAWPTSHILPLLINGRLNWLNADLARWFVSKLGVTGQMIT